MGSDETFTLLGSYSVYVGRRLPTFRGSLSVPPANANPLKWDSEGHKYTVVGN